MSLVFKKYKAIRVSYNGISIGDHLYISAGAYEMMGSPRYVEVSYDEKSKAVMLVLKNKQERGILKVSSHNNDFVRKSGSVGVVLNRQLPRGRYYFQNKNKEGFVFQK